MICVEMRYVTDLLLSCSYVPTLLICNSIFALEDVFVLVLLLLLLYCLSYGGVAHMHKLRQVPPVKGSLILSLAKVRI